MSESNHENLERLAYDAWLRRGRPIGSPEVDWVEAHRSLEDERIKTDQHSPPSAPGSTPTDLGEEPVPERSHAKLRRRRS